MFHANDENLETYTLFWLDTEDNTSEENRNAQQKLRSIINHLKIFEDKDLCQKCIEQVPKEDRLLLIVTDQLSGDVVPHIHHFRQVSSIYIYCVDEKKDEEWVKQFPKVKVVSGRIGDLISRIESDQKSRTKVEEPLLINIFNSSSAVDHMTIELNSQFIYFQLLIDCLLQMQSNEADKNELISLCREKYKGNTNQLAILDEFEHQYSGDRVLWWYTRGSFLYNMLNKALRMLNIDVLLVFRFFIRDIYQQLKNDQCKSPIRVYRGQLMSIGELNSLKKSINELISMNTFLSTSIDRQHVLTGLSNINPADDLQRVLFEINADPRVVTTKPFAKMTPHGAVATEAEVFFMLGSIFRLTGIRRDADQIWIIQMVLCGDDEHGLKQLFEHMKNNYGIEEAKFLSLGHTLTGTNKIDNVGKNSRLLLNEVPSDDTWSSDYVDIGGTQNNIGLVHWRNGDYKGALESFNKAVSIFIQANDENHPTMASIYNNIGAIYDEQEKYFDALTFFKKSLTIRKRYLPVDHLDLSNSYNNLGLVHRSLGHSDIALEYFKRSLNINMKSLPPQHLDIASNFINMGFIHEDKGEFEQALTKFQKAAAIFHQTLPSQHPDLVNIDLDIQRVSVLLK